MTDYAYNYEIGTTSGGTTNLNALSTYVEYPHSSFITYSQVLDLGDGTKRGAGWATCTWHWDFLKRAMRDKLKSFCSGASAVVYIRTRTNENSDEYKYYQAVMVWPQEEEKDAGRRMDFNITFTRLVEYTPTP